MTWRATLIFIVLPWLVVRGEIVWGQTRQAPGDRESVSLVGYVKNFCENSPDIHQEKKTLAVFIEFIKFGCLACLNNFLDLCDTMELYSEHFGSPNVILVFERDNQEYNRQFEQMKSWIEATGIGFHFRIAPSNIFERNNITEIVLIMLDRDCSFDYYTQLPLTEEEKRKLLRKLYREGN